MPRCSSHFIFPYLFGSHLPRQLHTCPQLPAYLRPACPSASTPTWAPPQATCSGAPTLAYILAHLPGCLGPASPRRLTFFFPQDRKPGRLSIPIAAAAGAPLCPRCPPLEPLSDRLLPCRVGPPLQPADPPPGTPTCWAPATSLPKYFLPSASPRCSPYPHHSLPQSGLFTLIAPLPGCLCHLHFLHVLPLLPLSVLCQYLPK